MNNLEKAINNAARDLPHVCNIMIHIENGAVWMEGFGPGYYLSDDPCDRSLAEQVKHIVDKIIGCERND